MTSQPKKTYKKYMTYTDKKDVEGALNLNTYWNNTMHTFFYSNIYEFYGNLEGMLDEGTNKTTVHNMHKLGWNAWLLK